MTQKRRPALTELAVKGFPRLMHQGTVYLGVSPNLDSPSEQELRAAQEYLQKLYYWYLEQTMNFSYSLQRGKAKARIPNIHITSSHPSPLCP